MPKKYVNEKLRKKQPKLDTSGEIPIPMCPFCRDEHPIAVNQVAQCGTYLEVVAVQKTYQGKQVVCVMCNVAGGTLIKVGQDYCHAHECTSGVSPRVAPPEFSKIAKLVFRAPKPLHKMFAKITGKQALALGYMKDGKMEEIRGYAWQKIK